MIFLKPSCSNEEEGSRVSRGGGSKRRRGQRGGGPKSKGLGCEAEGPRARGWVARGWVARRRRRTTANAIRSKQTASETAASGAAQVVGVSLQLQHGPPHRDHPTGALQL